MAEITMRNIVKRYGDGFPAVNDISSSTMASDELASAVISAATIIAIQ